MAETRTEALHEHAGGLDQQPPAVVLGFLADAQVQAAAGRARRYRLHRRRRFHRRRNAWPGRQARLRGGRQFRPHGAGRRARASRHLRHSPRPHSSSSLPAARRLCRTWPARPRTTQPGPPAKSRNPVSDKGDCLVAVSASGSTPYAVGALKEAIQARRENHRHRQQCRLAIARNGRSADPARNPARDHRRLDTHGRRHRAEDRAQHALDAGGDPSWPCA